MQEYIRTDQYLHQLSQIIARANRNFMPEKPDDSHTNLYYDVIGERITGRWFKAVGKFLTLAIDLDAWQFQILQGPRHVLYACDIVEKTTLQLETTLAAEWKNMGLDTGNLLAPMHFEIPEYPFAGEALKPAGALDLNRWKAMRRLANETGLHLLAHLQTPGEVRIWPHHFDTGVYTEPHEDLGIGFGLAMADQMVPSPYFYLAAYPSDNRPINYIHLPDLPAGRWIVGDHWKGAVLPLDELENYSNAVHAETTIAYLSTALNHYYESERRLNTGG